MNNCLKVFVAIILILYSAPSFAQNPDMDMEFKLEYTGSNESLSNLSRAISEQMFLCMSNGQGSKAIIQRLDRAIGSMSRAANNLPASDIEYLAEAYTHVWEMKWRC